MSKKIRGIVYASLLCLLSVVALSCTLESFTTGDLHIALGDDSIATRTIDTDIVMDIAYYRIVGEGPGETFEVENLETDSIVIEDLAIGTWTVTVEGFNASGILIGRGSSNATITRSATTEALVTVRPISGEGTLTLAVDWTEGILSNPSIEAALNLFDSDGEIGLEFTLEGTHASYTGTIPSGYYHLELTLNNNDTLIWSKNAIVRIVAGGTSAATYTINLFETGTGAIEVVITEDLRNPIPITLNGVVESIQAGESITVTAECAQTPDEFVWLLNGEEISSDSTTVTVTPPVGTYSLDFLMYKDSVYSSEGFTFSVLPIDPSASLQLYLKTMVCGDEISWRIDNAAGTAVASGSGYSSNNEYTVDLSLAPGTYTLYGFDSWGDGWSRSVEPRSSVPLFTTSSIPSDMGYLNITLGSMFLVREFYVAASQGSITFTVPAYGSGEVSDVLCYVDYDHADSMYILGALEALGYEVTQASSVDDLNQATLSDAYGMLIIFEQSGGVLDSLDISDLEAYISRGGKVMANSYWRRESLATCLDAAFTGSVDLTPMTITDDSVSDGVTNPVALRTDVWAVDTTGLTPASGGVSLATFPSSESAIVWGNGGNTLLLGFLQDTVPSTDGQKLFENLLRKIDGSTPMPVSLSGPRTDALKFVERSESSIVSDSRTNNLLGL